jgi:hypothetical protein
VRKEMPVRLEFKQEPFFVFAVLCGLCVFARKCFALVPACPDGMATVGACPD